MAVLVDNTKRTSGQVIGGYNEKQTVRIKSVYFEEKQVRRDMFLISSTVQEDQILIKIFIS